MNCVFDPCNTLRPAIKALGTQIKLSDIAGAGNCHFCQEGLYMLVPTAIFVAPSDNWGAFQTADATVLNDSGEPSQSRAIRYLLCADSQARTLLLDSSKMRS